MTKNNFLKNVIAIAFCLAAATIFSACGKDNNDGNGNGDGNGEETYTKGWPSDATLSDWSIGGITLPAGATDAEYNVVTEGDKGYISVNFKSYATNDNPFSAQFAANGWVLDGEPWIEEDGTEAHWDYRKDNWYAFYDWNFVRGSALFICKNCEEDF